MNNIVEQKSNLAKLLATENVTVQHKNVQTASFNPKTRVLILPIWKKMSPELYDLLLSHEVGHALWTPADGWHEAVCEKGRNYKGFLNVIEDARIEKKIKRKYPGLRRSYIKGFKEIMQMKIFGIENFDELNTFIDRINVFTKSSYTAGIDFNDEESDIIEEIKNLESWDDVVAMTDRLWDKAVEEVEDDEDFEFPNMSMNGMPDDELVENEDEGEKSDMSNDSGEQDLEASDTKTQETGDEDDEETTGKIQDNSEDDNSENDDDEKEELEKTSSSGTHGLAGGDEELEPNCETDEMFRHNEGQFNQENPRELHYVSVPKAKLDKILVDSKSINERITRHFKEQVKADLEHMIGHKVDADLIEKFKNDYSRSIVMAEFKKKNDRFISLMAKEFEMKKAATKYAKARLYTSGDIDINKIYKYKFDDRIFRKLTKLPKGKSHGMILTLDLSGSMDQNMKGSLEQICILTAFCKKVQIPFRVFGFASCHAFSETQYGRNANREEFSQFSSDIGNLNLNDDSVYLKEFIHSNMSAKDYKNAFENLLLVKNTFGGRYRAGYSVYPPRDFALGSTPLNQAIVALKDVITQFKTANQLDIVNTIFVHDGDANSTRRYYDVEDEYGKYIERHHATIVQDSKTRFQKTSLDESRNNNMTHTLLSWLKHATGTQIFGFFVSTKMSDAINYRYVSEDGRSWLHGWERRLVLSTARKQKFLESNIPGFDSFFILNDSNKLTTDNEEFEFEIKDQNKISTRNLARQFTNMNKAREVNRVLATKFVEKIAVKL